MLFNDYLEEYILDCEIRNLSLRTIETYRLNVGLFEGWLDEEQLKKPESINRMIIKKYIVTLRKESYKASYINTILKSLKSFFNYLENEDYIQENPMAKIVLLKEEKNVIETFNEYEIKQIVNHYNEKTFLSMRNKLMIAMLIDTGIRCTELRTLEDDFVFDYYIKVHGKGDKWRVIPISTYVQKQVLMYRRLRKKYFADRNKKFDEKYFFVSIKGKYLSTNSNIEILIKEVIKGCEIRPNIRCSPHTFRHYFAKTSIKNGQDIFTLSKLLGHSNIKITQRYLESMNDEEVLEKGAFSSPLNNF